MRNLLFAFVFLMNFFFITIGGWAVFIPVLLILGQNPLTGKADEEGRILEVAGTGSNDGLFDGVEDDCFGVQGFIRKVFVFSLILLYSFAHSIAAILIEVALLAISMGARF